MKTIIPQTSQLKNLLSKFFKIKIVLYSFFLSHNLYGQQLLAANENHGPSECIACRDNSAANNEPAKQDSASKSNVAVKKSTEPLNNNMAKAGAMIDAYIHGMNDADDNYHPKKSANTAITLTTLIGGPILGIIPTLATSGPVSNKELNIPKSALVSGDSYMKGYKSEANYIKKHNTWPRFVLAGVIWLAAASIILR
jgi:hypothetical protein